MSSIPKTQTGYGYIKGQHSIATFNNVPVAEPKGKEVLLKIEAAGLCQSDVSLLKAQQDWPEKFIMGHEIAGQIVKVGEDLADDDDYDIGTRMSLVIVPSCGLCKCCLQGNDNSCTSIPPAYGIFADGGFQEYLLVTNLRTLAPIPDNVTYEQAAVASDSILTPLHAINKVRSSIGPTSKVLLIGLGGLGLNALQILKSFGCYVVACDKKASAESLAKSRGADEFYCLIEDSDHGYNTFDVCFDFCGYQETSDACQNYAGQQGKLVTVGLGRSKLFLSNYKNALKELTVYFCFGGGAYEHKECLELVSSGFVKPLVNTANLEDISEYHQKLAKGQLPGGRMVFHPPGCSARDPKSRL